MPLTDSGLNDAVDGATTNMDYLALFDGDPSGAGTEISGGSPAYARQLVTWGAATGGVGTVSDTPHTFDIPVGATVSHYAWYTAVTGGTQKGYGALSASEGPYGAQGTYDVTAATLTAT